MFTELPNFIDCNSLLLSNTLIQGDIVCVYVQYVDPFASTLYSSGTYEAAADDEADREQ